MYEACEHCHQDEGRYEVVLPDGTHLNVCHRCWHILTNRREQDAAVRDGTRGTGG